MRKTTRKIGALGLALAAVLAVGAVTASAAFAEFTLFDATGTLPTSVKGKALVGNPNQVFLAEAGGVEVVCTELKASGSVTKAEETSQLVTVTYEKCSALGQPVDNIVAEYIFFPNGSVEIEKPIIIEVLGLANCSIEVFGTQLLTKAVEYLESGNNLIIMAKTTGIKSLGLGGLCGTKESTTGTYTGESEVELENGGKISVM